MPSVNPGPATTQTPNSVLQAIPVNTQQNPVPIGANDNRLLAVARGINLGATGDTAVMQVINAASWVPTLIVTANGQVSGVAGSIATASISVNTGPAATGNVIKAGATLANNNAANSAIALATAITAVAQTAQLLYINVGVALANATVDLFLYGYDLT
jgi:hypothetical protein